MQNLFSKKYIILFFLLFSGHLSLFSNPAQKLAQADSLYNSRRFTEALDIYRTLIEQEKVFSPSLLLKSAFICEQQKKYTESIYYLFMYYKEVPRKIILKKIESIAAKENYTGYNFNDLDIFYAYINKYFETVSIALAALCMLLVVALLRDRYKGELVSNSRKFVVLLIFVISYLFINYFTEIKYGIVKENNTLVMNAPSAGGKLMGYKQKGERFRINSESDIWVQTADSDTLKYLRKPKIFIY